MFGQGPGGSAAYTRTLSVAASLMTQCIITSAGPTSFRLLALRDRGTPCETPFEYENRGWNER
jgi:hypothetical protein